MLDTFWSGWDRILDVVLSAVAIYAYVVVLLRIAGKRATSKMNNFDWVVTVAIGAIASTGVIQKSVSVADAVVAIAVLVAAQWILHQVVIRSEAAERVVKASPTLLLDRGELLEGNLRAARVTEAEVLSALRSEGIAELSGAQWVILESDASLAVVPRLEDEDRSPRRAGTLKNVSGLDAVEPS